MSDQDLEKFLKSLRQEDATKTQIDQWQKAVSKELQSQSPLIRSFTRPSSRRWLELTAAMLIGVLMGSVFFNHPSGSQDENVSENATIEYVVTKSR
jgi:hypothetical protein